MPCCRSTKPLAGVGKRKFLNCRARFPMRRNDMCFRGNTHEDLTINLFLPLHDALWTADHMVIKVANLKCEASSDSQAIYSPIVSKSRSIMTIGCWHSHRLLWRGFPKHCFLHMERDSAKHKKYIWNHQALRRNARSHSSRLTECVEKQFASRKILDSTKIVGTLSGFSQSGQRRGRSWWHGNGLNCEARGDFLENNDVSDLTIDC